MVEMTKKRSMLDIMIFFTVPYNVCNSVLCQSDVEFMTETLIGQNQRGILWMWRDCALSVQMSECFIMQEQTTVQT